MGSYLQARHAGGEWLVRIEDLDPPREIPGAADAILFSLESHGFEWDGTVVYQSTRDELYAEALQLLRDQSLVFACGCSRRTIAGLAGHMPGGPYPGTCREAGLQDSPGRALRFRARDEDQCFQDLLQGRVCENVAVTTGDFVVRRRDGQFAYQLAVVVDDAQQGITEVVRGCDLLDSTPRQIQLQKALGLSRPRYMHLPVVLNPGGQKLSKQTGAAALENDAALSTLIRAHGLLGQREAAHQTLGTIAEFWAWAIETWDPSPLLGCREFAAPDPEMA